MRRRPAKSRAFTLLELLLVLMIIAVIAGMAAPSLLGFSNARRIANATDEVVAVTRYARTQAITRGLPIRLNLDPASKTYWLTIQGSGGGFDYLGEELGRVFTLPDAFTVSWDAPQQQDGQYLTFDPSGRTDPATIRLTEADGTVTEIACYTPTEMFHIVTDDERAGR